MHHSSCDVSIFDNPANDSLEPDPLLDGGQRLGKRLVSLMNTLEELKDEPFDYEAQFDTICRCRDDALSIRADFFRYLVGLALPPSPERLEVARLYADVFHHLSERYGAAARDLLSTSSSDDQSSFLAALSAFWTLNCLGHHMVIQCECYLKPNPGIWIHAHDIYDLAASNGLTRVSVPIDPNGSRTVEHAYKRLLLLGLSDPFHYPPRTVRDLFDTLDEWAELATITETDKPRTRCLFVIDPNLDCPAIPVLTRNMPRADFNEKWFVTRQVVQRAKQAYDSALYASAHEFKSTSNSRTLASVDILKRSILKWGLRSIRNDTRKKVQTRCELVAGFASVYAVMDDFKPMQRYSFETPTSLIGALKGSENFHPTCRTYATSIDDAWSIVDESENGWQLAAATMDTSSSLSVDELVAMRHKEAARWKLGVISWAQIDKTETIKIGVKALHRSAQSARLYHLDTNTDDSAYIPPSAALLLGSKSQAGSEKSLICRPSSYYPTGIYVVTIPGTDLAYTMEARSLRLATRSFVWFDVLELKSKGKQVG